MARGWESKSIEQQQEDAQRPRSDRTATPLTPQERERRQRVEELQLALARTQDALQQACHPRHRDMLRQQLESLREKIEKIKDTQDT